MIMTHHYHLMAFFRQTWLSRFPQKASSSSCSGTEPLGIVEQGYLMDTFPSCQLNISVKVID